MLLNKYHLLLFLVLIFCFEIKSQEKETYQFDSTNYSIENCVNEFSMDGIEKTKVGYQYWFADKNFLDGRTIKLSVVAPNSATHPPHKHSEDEFFFVLEGIAELFLNGEFFFYMLSEIFNFHIVFIYYFLYKETCLR